MSSTREGPGPAELATVVERLRDPGCPGNGLVRIGSWSVEYAGARAFATALELIFGCRVYDAASLRSPERILDGGGWVGLSVLRFRQLFPRAHITVFEPDPAIFAIMCRNLERNNIQNVETVQAALAGIDGKRRFVATGTDSGTLMGSPAGQGITVSCRRLSAYVDSPVSLLKLNIEGAEAAVIDELGDRLALIDQTLIEYHGFAGLRQTLHRILARLDEAGHTYIISHFNERNRACVPPLRLDESYRFFLLIYSRRLPRGTAPVSPGDERPDGRT